MGRWGDGEMGRWGDGEMGRWGGIFDLISGDSKVLMSLRYDLSEFPVVKLNSFHHFC
jgi:hypothetical protein